jgi:hypothetical protein
MIDKEFKKKHPDPERVEFIYRNIAQHPNFAGFKR